MQDVQVLVFKLAAIILIAIIGYIIASKKILGEHGKDVTSLILNRIALPFMIIATYLKIELNAEILMNSLYVIVIALLIYTCNYFYSRIMSKRHNLTREQESVYINGAVHANTAFLAFPLLFSVYGEEGLLYATIYYMVDNILLSTTGIKRLMPDKSKIKLAPVTIALLISLPIMIISNVLQIDLTNNFIYEAIDDIGVITTPLAFLFIGFIIYESKIKELLLNHHAIKLVIVKMLVIPLVFALVLKALNFDVEGLILIVALTQALMPPFSALLSMSYEYKQDVKMATSLVVLGHLFAIVSIPLLFTLFVYLFS
ncbi:AEC family transporter [Erysipelotrichaceae bacterium OttesenSCG-928-M19]|nr:AEC family transporter [Erysipelotrichaceae bacterium OttesenSCG-928-M19]